MRMRTAHQEFCVSRIVSTTRFALGQSDSKCRKNYTWLVHLEGGGGSCRTASTLLTSIQGMIFLTKYDTNELQIITSTKLSK